MSDLHRMVNLIKTAAAEAVEEGKPMAYAVGTVEKAEPELQIRISQQVTLTAPYLLLARNVTDYQTEISFDDPEVKQVFTTWDMKEREESAKEKICFKAKIKHKITIYNALKEGEKVVLLRLPGGNQYLILDRIGVMDT